MTDRETFTLIISDAGNRNAVPLMPRLRRLLKSMLRGYGIRCHACSPTATTFKVSNPMKQTEPN